jgi:hypothetical protein
MGFEQEASILVVRGWELACVSAWLVGLWLVVRAGSTPYLHGLFWGASGLAMWDWITNDVWLWNITADGRFFDFFTVAGRTELLWAPFSYGFFYAIPTVLALQYRAALDRTVGAWQYVLIPVALGFSDILIEGVSVGWLGLYDFAYKSSYEWWGVPWTNIVFIAVSQVPILFLARRAADLCRLAGLPSVGDPQRVPVRVGAARPAAERAAGEVPGGERNLAPFWMGLMVCPTGLYVAAWFSALFLERLDPFLH